MDSGAVPQPAYANVSVAGTRVELITAPLAQGSSHAQALFTVGSDTSITVVVSLLDTATTVAMAEPPTITVAIFDQTTTVSALAILTWNTGIARETAAGNTVSVTFNMPAFAVYVACVSIDRDAGARLSFTAPSGMVTGLSPAVPLYPAASASVAASGSGVSGYAQPTNPQATLHVSNQTAALLTFSIDVHEDFQSEVAVQFFVQKVPSASVGRRLDHWGTDQSRFFTSSFVSGTVVSGGLPALSPGTYAVLLFTERPIPGRFMLSIETETSANEEDIVINFLPHAAAPDLIPMQMPVEVLVDRRVPLAAATEIKVTSLHTWADAKRVVDAVSERAKESGTSASERFVDDDFPMGTCKRPKEIVPAPTLFPDELRGTDVAHGAAASQGASSCTALLAVLMEQLPHSLTDGVYPSTYSTVGAFAVRVFIDGAAYGVLVDDRLESAADGTQLAFARCRRLRAFWPSIVEKAMAKVYGGYDALFQRAALPQWSTEFLSLLTGAAVQSIPVSDAQWFEAVHRKQGSAFGFNVADNTALAIDDSFKQQDVVLLRCRVATGASRGWDGPWSPGSDLWKSNRLIARSCGVDPDAEVPLTTPQQPDRTPFWISAEDFTSLASHVLIVPSLPNLTTVDHHAVVDGAWPDQECCEAEFTVRCQQFLIQCADPGATLRIRATWNHGHAAGLLLTTLAEVSGATVDAFRINAHLSDSAGKRIPNASHPLGSFLHLANDINGVVIAVTAAESVLPGLFRVLVDASSPVSIRQMAAPRRTAVSHGWRGGSVVGFKDANNPRLRITVTGETPRPLLLIATTGPDTSIQGLLVQLVAGAPLNRWPAAEEVLATTPFWRTNRAALVTPALSAGVYTAWICRQAAESGSVGVECFSADDVRIDPM